MFLSSPDAPLQGHGLLIGQWQGRGLQSLQLVLAQPTWFCCFSGPGAEIQLRPRCYLQRGKITLGVRFLFSQFCPLPGNHVALHTWL